MAVNVLITGLRNENRGFGDQFSAVQTVFCLVYSFRPSRWTTEHFSNGDRGSFPAGKVIDL